MTVPNRPSTVMKNWLRSMIVYTGFKMCASACLDFCQTKCDDQHRFTNHHLKLFVVCMIIDLDKQLTEIDNCLRLTMEWDWQLTKIDNQLILTINWDQQFIATGEPFQLVMVYLIVQHSHLYWRLTANLLLTMTVIIV